MLKVTVHLAKLAETAALTPCDTAAEYLTRLPPTFAHTLFSSEILVLLNGFSLNKPSGSLLDFPFLSPIWYDGR